MWLGLKKILKYDEIEEWGGDKNWAPFYKIDSKTKSCSPYQIFGKKIFEKIQTIVDNEKLYWI